MLEKKGIVVEALGDGRCRIFIPGIHHESIRLDAEKRKYLPIAEPATPLMGIGGQNTPWGSGSNMIPGTWVWVSFFNDDVNRPVYFAQAGDGPFKSMDKFNEDNFCSQTSSSPYVESCDDQISGAIQPSSTWSPDFYGVGMTSFKPSPSYELLNMMGVNGGFTRESAFGAISKNQYDYQLVSMGQPADTALSIDNGGMLRGAALSSAYLDKSVNPWSTTSLVKYNGIDYLYSSKDEYKYVFSSGVASYPNTSTIEPGSGSMSKVNRELVYFLKDDGLLIAMSVLPEKIETCEDTSGIEISTASLTQGCTPIISFGDNGKPVSTVSTIQFKGLDWNFFDFDYSMLGAIYGDATNYIVYYPDTMTWIEPLSNTDITNEVCKSNTTDGLIYCDYSYKVGKWFIHETTTTILIDASLKQIDGSEVSVEKYYEVNASTLFVPRYNGEPMYAGCNSADSICIIPDDSVDNKWLSNQYGILSKEEYVTYDKTISFSPMLEVDDSRKHFMTLVIDPVPIFDNINPTFVKTPTIIDMGCEKKGVIDTYEAFGKLSSPSPTECGLNSEYMKLSWDYTITVEWEEQPSSIVDELSRDVCHVKLVASDNGRMMSADIVDVFINGDDYTFSNASRNTDSDPLVVFEYVNSSRIKIQYRVRLSKMQSNIGQWYDDNDMVVRAYCDKDASTNSGTKMKRMFDISKAPGLPIELSIAMCNVYSSPSFKISFQCNNITNPDGSAQKIAAGYVPGVNLSMFLGAPIARFFEHTAVSMLENNLWRYGMNIDFSAPPGEMTSQLKTFFNKLNGIEDQESTTIDANGQPSTVVILDKTRYRPYVPREVSKSEMSSGTKLIAAKELVLHGDRVLVLDADMIVINGGRICFNAESIGILTDDYNVVSASMPVWKNVDNSNTDTNLVENGTV